MGYDPDNYLLISGIQHFSFCRRQWALIHIEQLWNENLLTAEGRDIHSRVHDSRITDVHGGIITVRDMQIKSSSLGVTGCCDAVEFAPCDGGISLNGRKGTWSVYPIEYKRGNEKVGDCDRLQVVVQAMCLEEMFCCEISEGALFYHETRRREKVPITPELRDTARAMIREMHEYYDRGYTPKVKPKSGCSRCSLSSLCLPSLMKGAKHNSVNEYVSKTLYGGE